MAASLRFPFSGTVTWSGSGASLAVDRDGVRAGDKVFATIAVAPTQAAYIKSAKCTADTITFVLSAANSGNDAQIAYFVLRA